MFYYFIITDKVRNKIKHIVQRSYSTPCNNGSRNLQWLCIFMDFLSCDNCCQREADDPDFEIMCFVERLQLRFARPFFVVSKCTMGMYNVACWEDTWWHACVLFCGTRIMCNWYEICDILYYPFSHGELSPCIFLVFIGRCLLHRSINTLLQTAYPLKPLDSLLPNLTWSILAMSSFKVV